MIRLVFAVALVFTASCTTAAGGAECGEDTTLTDGVCTGTLKCGAGTTRSGNECVPAAREETTLDAFMAATQQTTFITYAGSQYELMHTSLDATQTKTYLKQGAAPVGGPYDALFAITPANDGPLPTAPSSVEFTIRAPVSCTLETIRGSSFVTYLDIHVGFVRDFEGSPQAVCATAGTVKLSLREDGKLEATFLAEFSDGTVLQDVKLVAESAYD